MILGLVLLGSEMGLIDAAFYLVFIGISALIVGLLKLAGVVMPMWVEWVAFAALSLISMVLFRKRLYTLVRGGAMGLADPLVGEFITIADGLQPHGSGRVEYRGSTWTVRNAGGEPIHPGQEVRIVKLEGLVLTVGTDTDKNKN